MKLIKLTILILVSMVFVMSCANKENAGKGNVDKENAGKGNAGKENVDKENAGDEGIHGTCIVVGKGGVAYCLELIEEAKASEFEKSCESYDNYDYSQKACTTLDGTKVGDAAYKTGSKYCKDGDDDFGVGDFDDEYKHHLYSENFTRCKNKGTLTDVPK